MYKVVPSEQLEFCRSYVIRCSPSEYFVGVCMEIENTVAVFWNVECVYNGTVCWIPTTHSAYSFSIDSTFKRIVDEHEYKRACQNAFERRAVNQILESKLGFKIYY